MPPAPPPAEDLGLAFLDARLTLATDEPALRRVVTERLGPFVSETPAGPRFEAHLRGAAPRVVWGGEATPLAPDLAVEQAFGLLLRTALDQVGGHLVLHASAVAREGRALLVAGPSGTGKTTLALALAERRFRLLSDDFTPLEPESGLVHPFPKAIGVRPGAATDLADALRLEPAPARPVRPAAPLLPARAAMVALVSPEAPDPHAPYRFSIVTAGRGRAIAEEAARAAELSVLEASETEVRLLVHPDAEASRALDALLAAHAGTIVSHGVVAGDAPAPGAMPSLAPLAPSSALPLLAREIQNRRPDGALMRRLSGDLSRLFAELVRALAAVRFVWLRPGAPRESAALLAGAFEADAAGSAGGA